MGRFLDREGPIDSSGGAKSLGSAIDKFEDEALRSGGGVAFRSAESDLMSFSAKTACMLKKSSERAFRRKGTFGGQTLEIVVCEFKEDGKRRLWTTTLRELYDYTMRAITNRADTKRWELHLGMSVAIMNTPDPSKDRKTRAGAPSERKMAKFATQRTIGRSLLRPPSKRRISQRIHHHRKRHSQHSNHGTKRGGGLHSSVMSAPGEEEEVVQNEPIDELAKVTHRERLGGYLHPRDMRRLVTPFTSSSAPAIMVRRHCILMNFDPLRAVVLRDRVLAVVSSRADTELLFELEARLKGEKDEDDGLGEGLFATTRHKARSDDTFGSEDEDDDGRKKKRGQTNGGLGRIKEEKRSSDQSGTEAEDNDSGSSSSSSSADLDELDDIDEGSWQDSPYELLAVDAVLSTVCYQLSTDAGGLHNHILTLIATSVDDRKAGEMDNENLRIMKDRVGEMEARINGFARATAQVLEDERELALMNLSRLLTNPERFILPVPMEVMEEEASEPEMLLEGYHHQALCMVQALQLLKGQISSTEELLTVKMDMLRNKLLFLNTLLALAALSVGIASLVGAMMGMNLLNKLEDDPNAFMITCVATIVGSFVLMVVFTIVCRWYGLLPRVK